MIAGTWGQDDPLLRGLVLEPAEAVIEACVLGDHRAHLPEHIPHFFGHIFERVFVTQRDRSQDTDVVAHCRLISEHALHLRAEEFEGYGLSHVENLVLGAPRVNYALPLNSSRPISMRRISLVPAPIS
jgi:hypothetical protein